MFIQRLQVEEGFLSGLDVRFSPGLNVIIGARGAGKTSVIELIRYCLQAPAFTEEAAQRGRSQAISVLQGGSITVTVGDSDGAFPFKRSGDPDGPGDPSVVGCTVLAQNEIEAVGAQRGGRLHLIDRFRPSRAVVDQRIGELRLEVRSLSAELVALVDEGVNLAQQVEQLAGTTSALEDAQAEQQRILETVQASAEERSDLQRLQQATSNVSTRAALYVRSAASLKRFAAELEGLRDEAISLVEPWSEEAGTEDLLVGLRDVPDQVSGHLLDAEAVLHASLNAVLALQEANAVTESQLATASRSLRQRLEGLQAGAGAVTRRVAELQEKAGQLLALQSILQDRRGRYRHIQSRRDAAYSALDQARQDRFEDREGVAVHLNDQLSPSVKVEVTRSASLEAYMAAIVESVRGSGLHYNSLAPLIAQAMSPLELVTAVEATDAAPICDAVDISGERALSLIAAIKRGGTSNIVSANIEDGVQLSLLDGNDYKDSERLSIGQRCTAVLPVLLSQHGDPLLVDQPEDHLDNAFIVDTLVRSLIARQGSDQFIFASHNANIPVLANADHVIVMDSDGQRGFVVHQGQLDDPKTVGYISRLMEGGEEAFLRRASFYAFKPE